MTPKRTCIGCRVTTAADELRRLALVEGRVVFDRTAPGRGAWLHDDPTCLALAMKRNAFDRAFRRKVDSSTLTGG